MDSARFSAIVERYSSLRVAVLGDFCLDRYLEIDPARTEVSLETGLPVHNVTSVRAQPGGAGTIVNNLSALGVGTILPVGLVGDDGEGYELTHALEGLAGVKLSHFVHTRHRHTFTYCKPLIIEANKPPVELNRLDLKNWTPTSAWLQGLLIKQLQEVAAAVDAIIVLDQVDIPETGVVTQKVLSALKNQLRPIVCVGESLAEREAGSTLKVVQAQTERALDGVSKEIAASIIIAYEPVWAIGTGKVATTEQAQEVHGFIRGLLAKAYGDAVAQRIRILYGGSMKPANAPELLAQKDIDGGLIGGASLEVRSFIELVNAAAGAS